MPTIKDVAKLAGVSVGTASRVLNNSPQISPRSYNAVHSAVKQLGYRKNAMAKALVRSKSETIGVLVSDVAVPFFGALVKGVDKVARANGRHILVANGFHDAKQEQEMLELLLSNGCKSIVVHSKGLSDEVLTRYCQEAPALVVINRQLASVNSRCMYLNNFQGSMDAVNELIAHGHREIAYVCSNENILDARERLRGYRVALEKAGVPFDMSNVYFGLPTDEGGRNASCALLRSEKRYTAIATYNDAMASGTLETLQDHGLSIPTQLSVIGFDNEYISGHLYPKLTTMSYPIEEMATHAAQLALDLEVGETGYLPKTPEFQPRLVMRNSVVRVNPRSKE
jgi:LacI family transcriptional regulator